jgi:hypothetical protein
MKRKKKKELEIPQKFRNLSYRGAAADDASLSPFGRAQVPKYFGLEPPILPSSDEK